jgi:predicted RNA-binding protein with PUA-like domain
MNEDDTFAALVKPMTEDEIGFGRKQWIYCSQHMAPHLTGWCTVSNRNKTKLDAQNRKDAYNECKRSGLKLYEG